MYYYTTVINESKEVYNPLSEQYSVVSAKGSNPMCGYNPTGVILDKTQVKCHHYADQGAMKKEMR